MKKTLIVLLLATFSLMATEKGMVTWVHDGDTIFIKQGAKEPFKARLIGLDTFEVSVNHRTFKQLKTLKNIHHYPKLPLVKDVLKWGHKAKAYAIKKVYNKEVEFTRYGIDKNGRVLVYVLYLNSGLIRNGLAEQYPTNKLEQVRKDFLLEASRKANLEKRGFYGNL